MSFKKSVLFVAICIFMVSAYIVQKGDTLWDLSEEYLRDPFAWPDLWQINPHIDDPHWIYPGDSICIPGEAPCPVAGEKSEQDIYDYDDYDYDSRTNNLAKLKGNTNETNNFSTKKIEYRKPEPPKIFNSYYQRLMPILEPIANKSNKGWFRVFNEEANRPVNHSLEHEVVLGFGRRAFPKLKAGDLAELWSTEKIAVPNAKGSFDEYFMHRIAAIAKISAVGDSLSRATIVQSFSLLSTENARSRPQTPVKTIDIKSFKQVKQVNADDMSRVLLVLDKSIVANLYSYVLLNKGSQYYYSPGSAVAFWDFDKRDATLPPRLLGRGIVVHSDSEHSVVLIRDIYNAARRIDAATPVSITHQPVR